MNPNAIPTDYSTVGDAPVKREGQPVEAKDLAPTQAGGGLQARHYTEGKINRAGMEHVLSTRGSVMVTTPTGPRLVMKPEDIPAALAALGVGESTDEQLAEINRRRAELDRQEKTLTAGKRK